MLSHGRHRKPADHRGPARAVVVALVVGGLFSLGVSTVAPSVPAPAAAAPALDGPVAGSQSAALAIRSTGVAVPTRPLPAVTTKTAPLDAVPKTAPTIVRTRPPDHRSLTITAAATGGAVAIAAGAWLASLVTTTPSPDPLSPPAITTTAPVTPTAPELGPSVPLPRTPRAPALAPLAPATVPHTSVQPVPTTAPEVVRTTPPAAQPVPVPPTLPVTPTTTKDRPHGESNTVPPPSSGNHGGPIGGDGNDGTTSNNPRPSSQNPDDKPGARPNLPHVAHDPLAALEGAR